MNSLEYGEYECRKMSEIEHYFYRHDTQQTRETAINIFESIPLEMRSDIIKLLNIVSNSARADENLYRR